jgi:nucleotide-binding universal stress UspA family protein
MELKHIVAATDESDAGRQAVRVATDLSDRASTRVTVFRVMPVEATRHLAGVGSGGSSLDERTDPAVLAYLRRWLEADVLPPGAVQKVELATAAGVAGIEICRFAERTRADLLVLGRKRHTPMMRLLLGDTADAVARRSRCPSLFVPPSYPPIRRLLVALDGSDRGMNVLNEACDFARQTGAELRTITVERTPPGEPPQLVSDIPMALSVSLDARVQATLARTALPVVPLIIRRGVIVESIVTETQEIKADVLVVGYHRGGPPGVLEAGSTARRLVHASPCAVLTIPL